MNIRVWSLRWYFAISYQDKCRYSLKVFQYSYIYFRLWLKLRKFSCYRVASIKVDLKLDKLTLKILQYLGGNITGF